MVESNNQNREWYLFDAENEVLGRLSTKVANKLRGKDKTAFRDNIDTGDYAVVINADKIRVTGKKDEQKVYHHHTGYLGHLKTVTYSELLESKPEEIIKHAVRGMLPNNKLREQFMGRLKIYSGNKHPHQNVKFKGQE
ncbi:MAG: 50S ribosomal protein L13 [bacterium ADurb.Bin400]|nr:MAG: 50S ribosomal protein L13 [bacterium ADurb.Bin400]